MLIVIDSTGVEIERVADAAEPVRGDPWQAPVPMLGLNLVEVTEPPSENEDDLDL